MGNEDNDQVEDTPDTKLKKSLKENKGLRKQLSELQSLKSVQGSHSGTSAKKKGKRKQQSKSSPKKREKESFFWILQTLHLRLIFLMQHLLSLSSLITQPALIRRRRLRLKSLKLLKVDLPTTLKIQL